MFYLAMRTLSVGGLVLALGACAEDPRVERIGLKRLEVRDGYVGDQSGDATGKPKPIDPNGTDSVSVFARTAYPLLQSWCKSCHAAAQSPLIAHPEAALAHEAILAAQKVDFTDVSRSRLVLRLRADNHNCPAEGCAAAAAAMQEALQEWGDALEVEHGDTDGITTAALKFADIETKRIESTNPPGVIRLEAEQATLKAPMAAVNVATASGGRVLATPAGAGSQNNVQTATASTTLGTAIYDFAVTTAGTYRVHGLVNAPSAANNAFWVRMDGGALQGWQIVPNGAVYGWDLADTNLNTGTTLLFTLTAGNHRMELRQREEQTKVDALVLTTDAAFDPANAKPPFQDVSVLSFDLAAATGIAGAKLTVELSDYSANAYMFKNPTLIVPSGSVKIKNMKLLINGVFLPQHATYTVVDQTVAAPGAVVSPAALVALKDKGNDQDEFQFLFEVLEAKP